MSCQPFAREERGVASYQDLPASTAVATAAMEAAATVEATATSDRAATSNCTTAADHATTKSTADCWRAPITGASEATIAWRETTIARPRSVEPAAAVEPVEPGARANEPSVDEVIRPVVPVRRARVGVITVIPISAGRRSSDVTRTHSDTNANGTNSNSNPNLCVSGCASQKHEEPKQSHRTGVFN